MNGDGNIGEDTADLTVIQKVKGNNQNTVEEKVKGNNKN